MLRLTWIDDLKAESDFRNMNIPFSKATVPFTKIDLKESGVNSARLGDPIVSDLVRDYAQMMRNGDAFPRPVCFRKSGYILTSGNQRCHAVKTLIESGDLPKDTPIEMYVLDTTEPLLLEAISRAANVCHGGRATWEERKLHACHMVREFGMATKDAAKVFGISESSINLQISSDKTRQQLAESGVDTTRVPTSVINTVSKLDADSSVFIKVGQLISQHNPTADKTKEYVERITNAKSEDARLGIVKKIEKELADESRECKSKSKIRSLHPRSPLRPRRDRIVTQLTNLAKFLDYGKSGEGFSTLTELQASSASDKKTIVDLWQRIELRMSLIMRNRD